MPKVLLMLSIPTDRRFSRTACLRSISTTLDVLYVRISMFERSSSEVPNRAAPSRVKITYNIIIKCQKVNMQDGPYLIETSHHKIGAKMGCNGQLVFRMVQLAAHMICIHVWL